MIVEFHVIQNLGPSNINRDDTGTPKNVKFGGTRRARVSSQSWKRAIRDFFREEELFDETELGTRTKRLVKVISEQLHVLRPEGNRNEHVRTVTDVIGEAVGIDSKSNPALKLVEMNEPYDINAIKSKYLVYAAPSEITQIVEEISNQYDDLTSTKEDVRKKALGKFKNSLFEKIDGRKAIDIALFGRMLADLPESNVDGATQFAHAISTHTIEIESDYYTAVDDLKPDDNDGADMIGYVDYVAPTLYRYANIDVDQLKKNLGGDKGLTKRTVAAFARAFVETLPGGKRTSMDTSTLPAIAVAVVRDRGRWSLVNAFVEPVDRIIKNQEFEILRDPNATSAYAPDPVTASIQLLAAEWQDISMLYGTGQRISTCVLVRSRYCDAATDLGPRTMSLEDWVSFASEGLSPDKANA